MLYVRLPLCMRTEDAAEYLAISETEFLKHVAPHMKPVLLAPGIERWCRADIDWWLSDLKDQQHEEGDLDA